MKMHCSFEYPTEEIISDFIKSITDKSTMGFNTGIQAMLKSRDFFVAQQFGDFNIKECGSAGSEDKEDLWPGIYEYANHGWYGFGTIQFEDGAWLENDDEAWFDGIDSVLKEIEKRHGAIKLHSGYERYAMMNQVMIKTWMRNDQGCTAHFYLLNQIDNERKPTCYSVDLWNLQCDLDYNYPLITAQKASWFNKLCEKYSSVLAGGFKGSLPDE